MAISTPLTPGAVQTIGGTGTTQKIFQSSIKNQAGVVQSPFVSSVTDYLLPIPSGGKLNGKRIKIMISGNVYVHGTSPTWQLQLLGSVAGSSNTILCQTAAVSLTTANNYDWSMEVNLICSNLPAGGVTTLPGGAGLVTGQFSSLINGTVGASATLTNNLASVDMFNNTITNASYGLPAYYLKAAALFGVTDAANLASLTEFYAFWEI